MIRSLLFVIFLIGSFTSMGWSQADPNEAVRLQAELNNAKANLEAARQERDKIVAQRWQDKKVANDYRESFNTKYQEAREKLDIAAADKNRLLEEMRAVKADMEQYKQDVEQARSEFLVLSAQEDKLDGLERAVQSSTPFKIPERIQQLNSLKTSMPLLKDKPGAVVDSLLMVIQKELAFTRSIETRKGELIFGGSDVGYGYKTRLGGVAGVQYDTETGQSAILLSVLGERGRNYIWQSKLPPQEQAMVQAAYSGTAPDSSLVFLPVDVLLSTSLNADIANQEEKSLQDAAKQFIQDGGVLMYPILALFILAILFSAERVFVWFRRGRTSQKKLDTIWKLLDEGEVEKAKNLAGTLKGAVGDVVRAVLQKHGSSRHQAEKSVQEVLAHEIPYLEKRLTTISVLGGAAPLLGLLGTVYGMIQLFEVITLYGTSDPKLLAGGISVALVTTETGLAVAIPIQLIHNFVSNRINSVISEMEKQALRFINAIWIDE